MPIYRDKDEIAQTLINLAKGILEGSVDAREMFYCPASSDRRKLKTKTWVLTIRGCEPDQAHTENDFKSELF